MPNTVHHHLPDQPLDALARTLLGVDADHPLDRTSIFASMDHRLWTVYDGLPVRDVFVLLTPSSSTGYCLDPVSDHEWREVCGVRAVEALRDRITAGEDVPLARDPSSPAEAVVTLARNLTAILQLDPTQATAQHAVVSLSLAGAHLMVEPVEAGLELDVITALRYPGSAENQAQREAALEALHDEVGASLEGLGFTDRGDGGLPEEDGDHVCVSASYRQTYPSLEQLAAGIEAVQGLPLMFEAFEAPEGPSPSPDRPTAGA
jgi:hypothetical protein